MQNVENKNINKEQTEGLSSHYIQNIEYGRIYIYMLYVFSSFTHNNCLYHEFSKWASIKYINYHIKAINNGLFKLKFPYKTFFTNYS